MGGRITVVVQTMEEIQNPGHLDEKIVAAAFWLPPNKRLGLSKVVTLMRAGVFQVLSRWGMPALMVGVSPSSRRTDPDTLLSVSQSSMST